MSDTIARPVRTPNDHGWRRLLVRHRYAAALWLVIIAAAWLRLVGIRYGLPALNDPDELTFELAAVKMLRDHTLNPGWFGHPATTTIYGLALVDIAVFAFGHLAGWFADTKQFADAIYADPTWVILPGRLLMLVSGVLCVASTYRLGRLLEGPATGLAAAILLALNPVVVTYSQTIRGDMPACLFMLLSLCSAVYVANEGRRGDYLKAGMWLGLAVASKWPFAIAGVAVAGAAILHAVRHPEQRKAIAGNVALFALCSLVTLCVVSPFLLLDHETALKNMTGEIKLRHLEAMGGTPMANAWWYIRNALLPGLQFAGLALALGGVVLIARNKSARAIIFPTFLAFVLLMISQHVVWKRWAIPVMPLLSIAAASAAVWLVREVYRRRGSTAAIAASAIMAALVVAPLMRDVLANARERSNDTRHLASHWASGSLPPGSSILIENFAFDLLPQPWTFLYPLGDAGCVDVRAMLHGKVAYADIEKRQGGRPITDVGTVSPGMLGTCQADYAILTDYDRYRAARDLFPQEYANYQRLLANGTIVATFRPEPGVIGGNTARVVHFDRQSDWRKPVNRSPTADSPLPLPAPTDTTHSSKAAR